LPKKLYGAFDKVLDGAARHAVQSGRMLYSLQRLTLFFETSAPANYLEAQG